VIVQVGCLLAFDTLSDDGTKVVPRVLIDYSHGRIEYQGIDTTSSSLRRGEIVFAFDMSGSSFTAVGAGTEPGYLDESGFAASVNTAPGALRMRMRDSANARISGDSLALYDLTSVARVGAAFWTEPPDWSQASDQ
jgi:hypothetical protein